jgi:hypothetical protein
VQQAQQVTALRRLLSTKHPAWITLLLRGAVGAVEIVVAAAVLAVSVQPHHLRFQADQRLQSLLALAVLVAQAIKDLRQQIVATTPLFQQLAPRAVGVVAEIQQVRPAALVVAGGQT